MERENGMICLDNLPINNSTYDYSHKILKFNYDNKTYYYKAVMNVSELYNELIAEEIAKDFGIPYVSYDLAYYDVQDSIGVISEDFVSNNQFIYMEEILLNAYGVSSINEVNNFEDIYNALYLYYKDINLVNKLINQIKYLFIFDVLIGNCDRHDRNYGFINDNGNINLGKVFDNGEMLNTSSIYLGYYRIGIDRSDYADPTVNLLKKFLRVNDDSIRELLLDKLSIISEENILNIIDRIEKKINYQIDEVFKLKIINKFNINREMINKVLNDSYVYKLN